MRPALEAAVAGLQSAFRGRGRRPHVEACPHCVANPEEAALSNAPIDELDLALLGRYGWKAITTWGDGHDFACLLPRMFELLAREPSDWVDAEVLLRKLALAEWRAWPRVEVAAVERYLEALWAAVLDGEIPGLDADAMLRALAVIVDDVAPYRALRGPENPA